MRATAAFPLLVAACAAATATSCGGGGDQRTLRLVQSSDAFTSADSSPNAPCAIKIRQQWRVLTTSGAVLAHGHINTDGAIQRIHGRATCASVTMAKAHVEDAYVISGCAGCGTTTVYDSTLNAQKGIVPLP